jgi:hypothetical protein
VISGNLVSKAKKIIKILATQSLHVSSLKRISSLHGDLLALHLCQVKVADPVLLQLIVD